MRQQAPKHPPLGTLRWKSARVRWENGAVGSPGAIVVGGHVNGLGLVRAFAARGIAPVVITTAPSDIAHRSRFVAGHEAAFDLDEHPEHLLELLERHAATWAGSAIVPANDEALAALARYRDRLASTYRVVAPPEDQARILLDKPSMLDVARAVGVDLPRAYGPAIPATAARPDLVFPVLVKPDVGHRFRARFGCKLFVAHERAELDAAIARLAAHGLQGQIADLVPGPDSEIHAYCTYLDTRGEPCGGLTVRKLRQSPARFGVARVAEIVADVPELRDATMALLRRIGFRGMASAEFKRDRRDGRFRFLEVNGRSVIYNGLLRRGGLDLAGLAWADHVGGHPERAAPTGWPGVWINSHADLLHSVLHRRDEAMTLSGFLAPYRRPKIDAVWSLADPRPFATEWFRTARAGTRAVWTGTFRDALADRTRLAVTPDRRDG